MPQTNWELTPDSLREIIDYDHETGIFTRRKSVQRWGKKIGFLDSRDRYLWIGIKGKYYAASRLAWFYVYGKWPSNQVDHINGNKLDNRISNLREASNTENSYNRIRGSHNTSGYKGVFWHRRIKKWSSLVVHDGNRVFLGYFDNPIAAYNARNEAAKKFHGEFMRG